VKHSEEWNREVLRPLVAEDPRRARAVGEGAIMRLWHGARSFDRYRQEFGLSLADNDVNPVPARALMEFEHAVA
jgi:hypothetical protein